MARRYERKTGQRQQSERELTIRAEFHEPPDLDKLCELLIRLALQQSGACRSEGSTRPKRPRACASASS
ncbi:hypothetical protein BW730_02040 [Tessaracoccus aquimaris]|uniref:Uncharacterized protein n=1 Tax=Tessaracoccus aquimaris TaxID=1332264 RepID=A0A1Q2CK90_9ACTN|nr:hypothetical protein [Tessaracoccus aquimaris]AQP46503.1 hypothetical protein BW730_02040 [Tessaracoccus aquimaris]